MVIERWRVLVDANVLVAGLLSRTSASAAILDLGEAEEIKIVVCRQILVEADRVFLSKFPDWIDRYRQFIKNLAPLLAEDPKSRAVRKAAQVIHPNDAPILAVAKQEQVDHLVTLNTRHFNTAQVHAFLSCPVVTPSEFITTFRKFWDRLG